MIPPRVYADFQNADQKGRLRLNCNGTRSDLASHQIELKSGLVLDIYADDLDKDGQPDNLQVTGVVEFSAEEQIWVARIDWSAIRHESERLTSVRQQSKPA